MAKRDDLEIRAGATSGTFSFQYGKLVDAQMGSLKGFQAVNAAVSLPDAHFNFDPSLPPLSVNSFPLNERIVLKRFFGIETAETLAMDDVPINEVDWDLTPSQVVPLSEVAELNENDSGVLPNIESPQEPVFMSDQAPTVSEQIVGNNADDRTSGVVRDTVPYAVLATSAARHRFPMYIMILLLLTAAGAFALVWKFSERRQPTLVAASSESASLPAAEPKSNPTTVDSPAPVIPAAPGKKASSASPSVVLSEPQNKRLSNPPSLPVSEPQVSSPNQRVPRRTI